MDRTIHIWEVESGRRLVTLHGHTNAISGLAYSPDGRLLASSSDETIQVWEWETGAILQTLRTMSLYAGMKIAGITGISGAQVTALKMLGAVGEPASA